MAAVIVMVIFWLTAGWLVSPMATVVVPSVFIDIFISKLPEA
jgi:hypothetical protein